MPAALVLEPGSATRDELVGRVGRGLLVSDFWYTRVLDPRSLVVTGLIRNGVWLVEDGRIDALAPGAVLGVGHDQARFPDGFEEAYLVPSLHLGSWNFKGGA